MRKTTLNQKTNYLCRHTSITSTKTGKGLQKLPQNADWYRWEMMDRDVFKTLMKIKILVNFDDLKWFGLTHVVDQVRWLFSEVVILKLNWNCIQYETSKKVLKTANASVLGFLKFFRLFIERRKVRSACISEIKLNRGIA